MTYQIGQIVPVTPKRGIVSDLPYVGAVWHALVTAPQQERRAKENLADAGVYCFYPTEERTRVVKDKRITTEHPQISRLIYARFDRVPNWDVMKERKVINGVFCSGGTPIRLSGDVIRTIHGLPTRADELRAAEEAKLILSEGDTVQIADGPLAGFFVDVTAYEAGRVWWRAVTATGLPIKGVSARSDVTKL